MAKLFDKATRLKPSTMIAVAERRFGDAQALSDTKDNARANGVVYLSGFVVEILLKALLVRRYPAIALLSAQAELRGDELSAHGLVWRAHELDGLLDRLPELEANLRKRGERAGVNYAAELRKVCAAWTIQARYASKTIQLDEANEMLARIKTLKEELK